MMHCAADTMRGAANTMRGAADMMAHWVRPQYFNQHQETSGIIINKLHSFTRMEGENDTIIRKTESNYKITLPFV